MILKTVTGFSPYLEWKLDPHCAQKHDFLRKQQGQPADTKVMQLEDETTCHTGDKSGLTKGAGLKAKRTEFYRLKGIVRHLFKANATPEECPNDQLHKGLEGTIGDVVRQLVGESNILDHRPRGEHADKKGGPLRTDAGTRRGPTKYLRQFRLVPFFLLHRGHQKGPSVVRRWGILDSVGPLSEVSRWGSRSEFLFWLSWLIDPARNFEKIKIPGVAWPRELNLHKSAN